MYKVAMVSPGLLPIPPVVGGSVETVMQKMAEEASAHFHIDIYGPTSRKLSTEEKREHITYRRFSAKNYSQYFNSVRNHITDESNFDLIQTENRPLFIPNTKASNPKAKIILSLHSLDHIAEKLISSSLSLKIFQQCDRILVYSRFMRDKLAGTFPQVAEKISFIHLATEPERFRPCRDLIVGKLVRELKQNMGIPNDSKVILFAGRIIPKKGVDVLLGAMQQVVEKYPDSYLVIVGSSWFGNTVSSSYIKDLQIKSAHLKGNIIFTNYVEPQKMPLYFAMADVFVCPSQWDEPFGLVNVEAMSCEVPVVASAKGGIPEIITDGVNGFLVPNETDPEAFAKSILRILDNPDLANTLGLNGRKKVREYFNWQRAGQNLVDVWMEILKNH